MVLPGVGSVRLLTIAFRLEDAGVSRRLARMNQQIGLTKTMAAGAGRNVGLLRAQLSVLGFTGAAAVGTVAKEFVEFEKQVRIAALATDDVENNIGRIREEVTDLSTEFGLAVDEALKLQQTLAFAGLPPELSKSVGRSAARAQLVAGDEFAPEQTATVFTRLAKATAFGDPQRERAILERTPLLASILAQQATSVPARPEEILEFIDKFKAAAPSINIAPVDFLTMATTVGGLAPEQKALTTRTITRIFGLDPGKIRTAARQTGQPVDTDELLRQRSEDPLAFIQNLLGNVLRGAKEGTLSEPTLARFFEQTGLANLRSIRSLGNIVAALGTGEELESVAEQEVAAFRQGGVPALTLTSKAASRQRDPDVVFQNFLGSLRESARIMGESIVPALKLFAGAIDRVNKLIQDNKEVSQAVFLSAILGGGAFIARKAPLAFSGGLGAIRGGAAGGAGGGFGAGGAGMAAAGGAGAAGAGAAARGGGVAANLGKSIGGQSPGIGSDLVLAATTAPFFFGGGAKSAIGKRFRGAERAALPLAMRGVPGITARPGQTTSAAGLMASGTRRTEQRLTQEILAREGLESARAAGLSAAEAEAVRRATPFDEIAKQQFARGRFSQAHKSTFQRTVGELSRPVDPLSRQGDVAVGRALAREAAGGGPAAGRRIGVIEALFGAELAGRAGKGILSRFTPGGFSLAKRFGATRTAIRTSGGGFIGRNVGGAIGAVAPGLAGRAAASGRAARLLGLGGTAGLALAGLTALVGPLNELGSVLADVETKSDSLQLIVNSLSILVGLLEATGRGVRRLAGGVTALAESIPGGERILAAAVLGGTGLALGGPAGGVVGVGAGLLSPELVELTGQGKQAVNELNRKLGAKREQDAKDSASGGDPSSVTGPDDGTQPQQKNEMTFVNGAGGRSQARLLVQALQMNNGSTAQLETTRN